LSGDKKPALRVGNRQTDHHHYTDIPSSSFFLLEVQSSVFELQSSFLYLWFELKTALQLQEAIWAL